MPAIRTDTTLTAPFTLAQFVTAFKAAMSAAGYSTPLDEWSNSGNDITNIIYRIIVDSSSIKGIAYIKATIKIENGKISISQNLFDDWSVPNRDGTNPSGVFNSGLIFPDTKVFFTSISHLEMRMILVMQSNFLYHFGLIRPVNMPKFWNDNFKDSCLYAFIPADEKLNSFYGVGSNGTPYKKDVSIEMWTMPRLQKSNNLISATPLPEILTAPFLISPTPLNFGSNGQFSDEIGLVASEGIPRLQIINVTEGNTVEKWLMLTATAENGIAIRVNAS